MRSHNILLFIIILLIITGQSFVLHSMDRTTSSKIGIYKKYPSVDSQLFDAVSTNDYLMTSKALCQGANPFGLTSREGHTTLIAAAIRNNCAIARELIKACPSFKINVKNFVNTPDRDGTTPLIYAAYGGHSEIVNLLLKYQARIDLANAWGATALEGALNGDEGWKSEEAWQAKKAVISALLQKGATLPLEKIPLVEIIENADREIQFDVTDFLLKNYHAMLADADQDKFDVSYTNARQELACYAASNGFQNLLKLLFIVFDAEIDMPALSTKLTPLQEAQKNRHDDIVTYLKSLNLQEARLTRTPTPRVISGDTTDYSLPILVDPAAILEMCENS